MQHQEKTGSKDTGRADPVKKPKSGKDTKQADLFAFHPTFYFDSLSPVVTKSESKSDGGASVPLQSSPHWQLVAKAPVTFGLQDFWTVMNRWITEAPSIIPPVESVEIIQDMTPKITEAGLSRSQDLDMFPEYVFLKDTRAYRRGIHRRLIPKRKDKDPIMDEAILFYDNSEIINGSTDAAAVDQDTATAFAIFAPILGSSPSLDRPRVTDDWQTLVKSLPFYYPGLRAFRYGYQQDPEEDQESEHGHTETGDGEYNEDSTGTVARRIGWITLDLLLAGDEGVISNKLQYAFRELFKKLFKWGVNTTKGYTKSKVQHDVLVPKDLYLETYARLKEKHAKKWLEQWPERTDPRKFVFEDIAIAAWLVALWQLEREQPSKLQWSEEDHGSSRENGSSRSLEDQRGDQEEQTTANKRVKLEHGGNTSSSSMKQTFMDLGCGNGLLSHILNEEGHVGKGVDISSRKVWELYGSNTRLEAKALIPNEASFEDVDWIIGNHADELAPWVPIIAARSKPWTKFVVIPCCFFDLTGKYTFPRGYPEGKYKAYVDFIESMIDLCGYQVEREVLRIPSTKNIALVGRKPSVDAEGQVRSEANVLDCINTHVQSIGGSAFVPRISDREKQQLHWSSHEASLARRGISSTEAIPSATVVDHPSSS